MLLEDSGLSMVNSLQVGRHAVGDAWSVWSVSGGVGSRVADFVNG